MEPLDPSMSKDPSQSILRIEKLGRSDCEHCGEKLNVEAFRVFERIECPECGEITRVPGRFGHYYLLEELGKGGMGAVYLGRDANLHRKVAIKVLKPKFGKNPDFVQALLKEAKAAAALNHKNLVHIFHFGQEREQPYIAMEWVNGIRLDECIDPETEQEENGWLDVMGQVAQGLAAAEDKHIIHGDIKPANILMNEDGVAKVSDFGIARFQGAEDDRILGTPLYIAPEKSQGHAVDARSDQFSMGATFYHILSGHPPFSGSNPREVVLHRFERPAPDIRERCPHFSRDLSRMLQRMMATEPGDRYPDFRSLAGEIHGMSLKREARRLQREGQRKHLAEEARMLRARRRRKKRLLWGCAVLAGVIVYVLMALFF